MAENSVKDLMAFFSTEDRPVKTGEFMEFWKSCDEKAREYYKNADISG